MDTMEMIQQANAVDPLYSFETHFPEKFSRLHLNPEYGHASKRTRKPRARAGVRYKTQPVTFDEIQEVDEEQVTPTKPDEAVKEGLKCQLQAFSKSMDGLVGKPEKQSTPPRHRAHSTHGLGNVPVIEENIDCEDRLKDPTSPSVQSNTDPMLKIQNTEDRLPEVSIVVSNVTSNESVDDRLQDASVIPDNKGARVKTSPEERDSDVTTQKTEEIKQLDSSAQPLSNIASRRNKITAKAKRRQKQADDGESCLS